MTQVKYASEKINYFYFPNRHLIMNEFKRFFLNLCAECSSCTYKYNIKYA